MTDTATSGELLRIAKEIESLGSPRYTLRWAEKFFVNELMLRNDRATIILPQRERVMIMAREFISDLDALRARCHKGTRDVADIIYMMWLRRIGVDLEHTNLTHVHQENIRLFFYATGRVEVIDYGLPCTWLITYDQGNHRAEVLCRRAFAALDRATTYFSNCTLQELKEAGGYRAVIEKIWQAEEE